MSNDERGRLKRRLANLKRRLSRRRALLNKLEEQAARFSPAYTPAHLLVDIEELQAEINQLQTEISLPQELLDNDVPEPEAPPAPASVSMKKRAAQEALEEAHTASHFVGRESDLAAYRETLARDRFVIIKGMPGVGKTTLGAKLAHQVIEREEQIFWFTFDPVEKNTAEALFRALAAFLDLRGYPDLWGFLEGEIGTGKPLDSDAKLNLLRAGLSSGDYLLCFDDFQVVKDVSDIVHFFRIVEQRFLNQLTGRYIIMGREIPPRMEYLVAKFLEGFTEEEARSFIETRNLALSPPLLRRLWQRTEGNAMLLKLSVSALAALDGEAARRTFIEGMARREGDIRDYLMTEIYGGLRPDERKVIGALSIFPAPVEREILDYILSAEGIEDVTPRIDALQNTLIVGETEDGRIQCHGLVQEYCYYVLNRRDRERFHRRAADYYDGKGNYLAAAHHHFERGDQNDALNMLIAHARDIINAGEAGAMLEQLTRFQQQFLGSELWVALCQIKGDGHQIRGEYQPAVDAYQTALEEATREETRAELLRKIGSTYEKLGEYELAKAYFRESLNISETLNDRVGIAHAYRDIGWIYYRLEQLDQARECFNISLEIGQQLGDKLLLAWIDLRLGLINWEDGQLEEARKRFDDSRRIFRSFGERVGEAWAMGNLGLVYGKLGNRDKELACYQKVLEIQEQIGDVDGLRIAYNNLGNLYYLFGNHTQAIHYYRRLAQLAHDSGQKRMLSTAYAGLADAYLAQNAIPVALEYAQKALRVAQDIGSGVEWGVSCRILGEVWLALGDAGQAKASFEQSIPLLEEAGEAEELTRAQQGLNLALAQSGAATLFGKEDHDYEHSGSEPQMGEGVGC
jgi:tetratricopeptide (TPR) repeat protein